MDQTYLETAQDVYRQAALEPEIGLCCTTTPIWRLPGLSIPQPMLEMNYGCGSTVHPRDLGDHPTVLYVGVGGGMELLQFAYFSRRQAAVIGVDLVEEMLLACRANLDIAARENAWFQPDFVDLRKGDALALPLADASVDVAAQQMIDCACEAGVEIAWDRLAWQEPQCGFGRLGICQICSHPKFCISE